MTWQSPLSRAYHGLGGRSAECLRGAGQQVVGSFGLKGCTSSCGFVISDLGILLALCAITADRSRLSLCLFIPCTWRAGALFYPTKHPGSFRVVVREGQSLCVKSASSYKTPLPDDRVKSPPPVAAASPLALKQSQLIRYRGGTRWPARGSTPGYSFK